MAYRKESDNQIPPLPLAGLRGGGEGQPNAGAAPPSLRVAIWCAVSSPDQARADASSLDDQERAGREFAQAIGGIVTHVFKVPGHTRDIVFWHDAEAAMPAYRELREAIDAHAFDVLHCLDVDRLGRDPALSNQVVSFAEKNGAEVYFASAPHQIGQKTAGYRYLFAIQSTRAGEDQALRTQRIGRGIASRVRRGLWPTLLPYGYNPIRDSMGRSVGAEFDDSIEAIQLITSLFLEGLSYSAIAAQLNQTPWKPCRVARWDRGSVRCIANNDSYAGILHWGDVTSAQPSPQFPILWDRETHRAIIAERKRRARHTRRRGESSPLNGIAFCARCGGPMVRNGPPNSMRLRCSTRAHRRDPGTPDCGPRSIRELLAIDALRQYLEQLLDPDQLRAALAQHQNGPDLQQQIEAAQRQVDQTQEKRTRLALAYASATMDAAVYRSADAELYREFSYHQAEVDRLRQLRGQRPSREEREQSLAHVLGMLDTLFTVPTAQTAALLRRAGIRMYIRDGLVSEIRLE